MQDNLKLSSSWPQENIPAPYLELARNLIAKTSITKREFVDLCLMLVTFVEDGQTTLKSRSDMALYIANLWLRHENIADGSILDDIGGQFGEFEIRGAFAIDNELIRLYWEELKAWVKQADEELQGLYGVQIAYLCKR